MQLSLLPYLMKLSSKQQNDSRRIKGKMGIFQMVELAMSSELNLYAALSNEMNHSGTAY